MDYLVLHAPSIPPYLEHPFADGSTALEHVVRRATLLLGILSPSAAVYLLADEEAMEIAFPNTWNLIPVVGDPDAQSSSAAAFRALDAALPAEDGVLIMSSLDAPFFDVSLAHYLYRLHRQAWCDYTFGDGFPAGYAVEVLRRGVVSSLAHLAESGSQGWTRSFVFDALSRDINAFDVETEAATEDLALLRLSITVDTRGNFVLCRRLVERGLVTLSDPHDAPNPAVERYDHRDIPLLTAVRDDPQLRRTLPYYYQIQITDELAQRPAYLPWNDATLQTRDPGTGSYLAPADWDRLISEIAEVTPEAVLSIGYRGEPSLHPEIPHLLQTVGRYPGLRMYIETSGIGWKPDHISALQSPAVAAVIVELDTIDAERYQHLRGEGLAEALQFIEHLRRIIPDRVYAQATRLKETEWELQTFFKHWDGVAGVQPLIQKYNSWAGRLPDLRVLEDPPLQRIPCWHLQRDMVIRLDGDVPRCVQDLDGEGSRGNVFAHGIERVWMQGEREFVEHSHGVLAPMCERCDEYYTFNA
ncbi:MAG: spiro-SPASM protein [Alkalispirochaeta sp.]